MLSSHLAETSCLSEGIQLSTATHLVRSHQAKPLAKHQAKRKKKKFFLQAKPKHSCRGPCRASMQSHRIGISGKMLPRASHKCDATASHRCRTKQLQSIEHRISIAMQGMLCNALVLSGGRLYKHPMRASCPASMLLGRRC